MKIYPYKHKFDMIKLSFYFTDFITEIVVQRDSRGITESAAGICTWQLQMRIQQVTYKPNRQFGSKHDKL